MEENEALRQWTLLANEHISRMVLFCKNNLLIHGQMLGQGHSQGHGHPHHYVHLYGHSHSCTLDLFHEGTPIVQIVERLKGHGHLQEGHGHLQEAVKESVVNVPKLLVQGKS